MFRVARKQNSNERFSRPLDNYIYHSRARTTQPGHSYKKAIIPRTRQIGSRSTLSIEISEPELKHSKFDSQRNILKKIRVSDHTLMNNKTRCELTTILRMLDLLCNKGYKKKPFVRKTYQSITHRKTHISRGPSYKIRLKSLPHPTFCNSCLQPIPTCVQNQTGRAIIIKDTTKSQPASNTASGTMDKLPNSENVSQQ
jgi:hypothetical protein